MNTSYQVAGEPTGSVWLWLIPIVVGWLQLSPKCDFDRLQAAYERADRYARGTTTDSPIGKPPVSTRRALTIIAQEEDVLSPDQLVTPPVFNYSRSLQWASTAETIFLVFKVASEKAEKRIPVRGSEWFESEGVEPDTIIKAIHPSNRYGSPHEITEYCAQSVSGRRSHWAPGVFTRMIVASCASLALQWGIVGAAFIVTWFTPTIGLGCRSISYLLYGVTSTVIWMMLLTSSILAHYSAAYSNPSLPARVALASSHWLRRIAKLLAIVNAMWLVIACALQYANFYNTCFCNSSVFSGGKAAYTVVIETTAQAAVAKAAWIGSLVMASISMSFFLGLVNILLDNLPS